MRVACTFGPLLAVALRWCGMLLILLGLLGPNLARGAEQPAQPAGDRPVVEPQANDDGGACGEDEEAAEELIDCGSDLDSNLDDPWAIALLRTTEVRMTAQQCEELLADIWSQQSCSAANRECGKLQAGGIAPSGLELVSSSASGQLSVAPHDLAGASVRRLARPTDERMPKLRDLLPPVPPPKLAAC